MSDSPLPSTASQPLCQRGLARREALVLAAATGLGAWVAWRQTRAPQHADTPAGDPLPPTFWQQTFDTPTGGSLSLNAFQGRPLLLNFWATWCPPCVKEMPELDRFHRDFGTQGWQVVGLAVDGPTPVRAFLGKVGVGFPIGLAGFGGTELAQSLGNTTGGLPFTVLIDARGRVRHRILGATHYADLATEARRIHPPQG